MNRILAIIERDLRMFKRSPALIFASLVLPLVQLVILGYAFGGNLRHLKVAVVDQDHGMEAVNLRDKLDAIEATAQTFETRPYADLQTALKDLRNGRLNGVIDIPPHFTRDRLAQADPKLALIVDNTDNFSASTLESSLTSLVNDYYQNGIAPRTPPGVALEAVELYGYTPYIQYFLPAAIALAIFITAMIGGGIMYIDDKARGVHEGYLVTPIGRTELILGFTLAGTVKGIMAGVILTLFGTLIAGIPNPLDPWRLVKVLMVIVPASLAFISMMFLMMVRTDDPLVPRSIFGVLNTLLFFPSGAIYPISAFPSWMRGIAVIDPFTYAIHALKALLLKNTGLAAITGDIGFLLAFSLIMMVSATALFRRTF
ncbi:MAG: ABC-2 transporter permease [Terriglobia bacterium]